jgi:NDP-sugar pyrophosphorylase family protein
MKSIFPVTILAGGLATRMRPLTTEIPKALIEVNGEPFIAHQLRLLKQHGIDQVVLCVSYLGEKIVSYVGDGQRFGLEVQYSFDGATLLGTAGALKKALPLFTAESFFVLYGDSYLTCNYRDVQKAFLTSKKLGLMTVFKNEDRWDKSNVIYHEEKILAYDKANRNEKMKYVDYGLGLFHKTAFDEISENESFDLATLYQNLLQRNQLAGFEVKERFYEIGSFEGLEEIKSRL